MDHAGLIGRIGRAEAPLHVASQLVFKADTEGRLFLGINDGDVGNNAGEFTATIRVNPVDIDPASLVINGLFEVFNAQDIDLLAGVFRQGDGRADHRCLPRSRRTHIFPGRVRVVGRGLVDAGLRRGDGRGSHNLEPLLHSRRDRRPGC